MDTTVKATTRLIDLINAAANAAGNEAKLGPMVEATRHHVNAWKHGKRTCPIEAQVLMAAIAKHDVAAVIKDVLIERNAGTARGEKLVSALGKGWTTIGAVTALTLCGVEDLAFNLPGVLRCINWVFR
jgi:hypothetical protein